MGVRLCQFSWRRCCTYVVRSRRALPTSRARGRVSGGFPDLRRIDDEWRRRYGVAARRLVLAARIPPPNGRQEGSLERLHGVL